MSHEVKRYSQIYERSAELLRDSQRMRKRLLRVFQVYVGNDRVSDNLAKLVEKETGIDVFTYNGYKSYPNWQRLFERGELRDLFDAMTFAVHNIPDRVQNGRMTVTGRREVLKKEFSRVLSEENVGYQMDEAGTVRRRFDEALESERRSLLNGLDAKMFCAAKEHLRALDSALLSDPTDGRKAIQAIFDVLENIFKLGFSGETQLNKRAIERRLRAKINSLFAHDDHVKNASQKVCSGFAEWVDSAHFYRHEAGKPNHVQPPEILVLVIVGNGYSFARWLTEIAFD